MKTVETCIFQNYTFLSNLLNQGKKKKQNYFYSKNAKLRKNWKPFQPEKLSTCNTWSNPFSSLTFIQKFCVQKVQFRINHSNKDNFLKNHFSHFSRMSAASAEGSGPDGDNNKNAFYECNVCFDIATDPVLSLVNQNEN